MLPGHRNDELHSLGSSEELDVLCQSGRIVLTAAQELHTLVRACYHEGLEALVGRVDEVDNDAVNLVDVALCPCYNVVNGACNLVLVVVYLVDEVVDFLDDVADVVQHGVHVIKSTLCFAPEILGCLTHVVVELEVEALLVSAIVTEVEPLVDVDSRSEGVLNGEVVFYLVVNVNLTSEGLVNGDVSKCLTVQVNLITCSALFVVSVYDSSNLKVF